MDKIKNKYCEYLDSVKLNDNELNDIKINIINSKNNFKFSFRLVTNLLLIIISLFTISFNVVAVVKDYRVISNSKYVKTVEFNGYINKKYDKDLFIKDGTYKLNDIEKKLGLNLLESKKLSNNEFKVFNVEIDNSYISKIYFWSNNFKYKNKNINVGFEVNTKENGKSDFKLIGDSKMSSYYIKNLDTNAVILDTNSNYGALLANFQYEGIIYSIEMDKIDHSIDDLYYLLDSFNK